VCARVCVRARTHALCTLCGARVYVHDNIGMPSQISLQVELEEGLAWAFIYACLSHDASCEHCKQERTIALINKIKMRTKRVAPILTNSSTGKRWCTCVVDLLHILWLRHKLCCAYAYNGTAERKCQGMFEGTLTHLDGVDGRCVVVGAWPTLDSVQQTTLRGNAGKVTLLSILLPTTLMSWASQHTTGNAVNCMALVHWQNTVCSCPQI